MKRMLLRVVLAAMVLAAGGLGCHKASSSSAGSAGETDGYPVVCRHCGHFFVIPRDQIMKYPGGPNGEGLKCEKCGKFGARAAKQCQQCKQWYIAESRGAPCPQCSGQKPAERS